MELPSPFLRVGMDIPFHLHGLVLHRHRVRIGRCGRLARRADDHAGAMDMEADRVSAFQGIPQSDLDTVTLVATDHGGLYVDALNAVRDSPTIGLFLLVISR